MHNLSLKSQPPLNNFKAEFNGISILELTEIYIYSLAIPPKNISKLNKKLKQLSNVHFPNVGFCSFINNKKFFIMGLQPDQYFLFSDKKFLKEIKLIKSKFFDLGYFTDQSDSWSILNVSGKKTRSCLERICPINLDKDRFLIGQVARTAMEHVGVIITRLDEDEFLLLAPRSSANSFLHAIETTIHFVL